MKKRLILIAKILLTIALLWGVYHQLSPQWAQIKAIKIHINWAFAPLAVLAFCGVFLTSGLVWRWMASRMGDRSALLPTLSAYTFSQMGKYIPGKVLLLLMRVNRTTPLGMTPQTCTLSTILENATYMVSGGLVAAVTIAVFKPNLWIILAVGAIVAALLTVCHPTVFYWAVNKGLTKLKRPPVEPQERLAFSHILLGIALFIPCWLFGGLALWAAIRTVLPDFTFHQAAILPGAFAASVIGGMAFAIAPGGFGAREGIQFFLLQAVFPNALGPIGLAIALQRLFQIAAELLLGSLGFLLSRPPAITPAAAPAESTSTGIA